MPTATEYLERLHKAVVSRLSVDDPLPSEREELWAAWKAAGEFLNNKTSHLPEQVSLEEARQTNRKLNRENQRLESIIAGNGFFSHGYNLGRRDEKNIAIENLKQIKDELSRTLDYLESL
jgi:hypothetical protein